MSVVKLADTRRRQALGAWAFYPLQLVDFCNISKEMLNNPKSNPSPRALHGTYRHGRDDRRRTTFTSPSCQPSRSDFDPGPLHLTYGICW